MRSIDILSVIAAVVFHAVVTLPLAATTTERFVRPWVASTFDSAVPDWAVVLVVFVVMGMAFVLRAHVVGATAHEHHTLA